MSTEPAEVFTRQLTMQGQLWDLAQRYFPLNRSLTGPGVLESLQLLKEIIPDLQINGFPSGLKAGDWTVPPEWECQYATLVTEDRMLLADYNTNNLSVVGYSQPIDEWMDWDTLAPHLHSLPDHPTAIPYVTSYYKKDWGFCLTHEQYQLLSDRQSKYRYMKFRVKIVSTFHGGVMHYAELILPGASQDEVLFSTYICHPSMGNNETSGPVVTAFLAQYLQALSQRKYTYRILFLPETIGAIAYLQDNGEYMKKHVKAGWQITCVGDTRCWSFLPTPSGSTLSDRISLKVLQAQNYASYHPLKEYSFLDRGSDERQWCYPGVDLPVASIMRSKYGEYPEYHTSLDDLTFISAQGLEESFQLYKELVQELELGMRPKATTVGEPFLSIHGWKRPGDDTDLIMDILAYSTGQYDCEEIATLILQPYETVRLAVRKLYEKGLVTL